MPGGRRLAAAVAIATAAVAGALVVEVRDEASSTASARVAAPPLAAAARAGATNVVRPARVAGYTRFALVCKAIGKGCSKLTRSTPVPVEYVIDARAGAVSVATKRPDGTAARTKVYGGRFKLANPVDNELVARLVGGALKTTCATPSSKVVRKLESDGEGRFRIDGRYAHASTTRGHQRVTDRCDSTVVRVVEGTAEVKDMTTSATTTLAAGATYRATPRAAKPAPALVSTPGVDNAVRPVSVPGYDGDVQVCKRVASQCRKLTKETLVPIGSFLNLREAAISVETVDPQGAKHRMTIFSGVIQLRQGTGVNPILKAVLVGGDFKRGCRRKRTTRSAVPTLRSPRYPPYSVRKTRFTGKGPIQADGKNGNAIAPGTAFSMDDRCDGTLVTVTSGAVKVRDVRRKTTTRVTAPGRKLVRRPAG